MTSRCSARCSGFARISAGIAAILLAVATSGCGRPGSGGAEPTPTHIVQPTPDPTMVEVIRGNASPVAYLPPLQIAGSPTPVPAAARPAVPNRSAPKPAVPAREAPPAREPAPAAKPAPSNPAPRPAPTAAKPTNANSANGTGASGAPPAIINPSTLFPGGAGRPNPTPSR